MYYPPNMNPYQYSYYVNGQIYNDNRESMYWPIPGEEVDHFNRYESSRTSHGDDRISLKDYGSKPFVVNINEASKQNKTYRTALWTGKHLQVTLMSIKVGGDIGLEIHPDTDQFLRIEQGQGMVQMGKNKHNLNFKRNLTDDSAIMVPAGTWHNVINTGNTPLKLYSIYAPPHHPFGTVHVTKADAMAAERYGQGVGSIDYSIDPQINRYNTHPFW